MLSRYLGAALLLGITTVSALSLSVDTTPTTQCDDISISWTGGQPPFQVLLTPVFGVPRNFSVSSGNRFHTTLTFPSGSKFLVSVFDKNGFTSGATSMLLTVGPSTGGVCNATPGSPDFTFSLNDALVQCGSYTFSEYGDAAQPITVLGLIPAGETFVLRPPTGDSYTWTADLASGTSVVFIVFDSRGHQGGSSSVKVVGSSQDDHCLGSSFPSSTLASPSSTTPSASASSSSPSSSSGTVSPGVIAGTVLGGLVLLAAFVSLGLFLLRKFIRTNRHNRNRSGTRPSQRFSLHSRIDSEFDHPPGLPAGQHPYPLVPSNPEAASTQHLFSDQYTPTPFVLSPPGHTYNSSTADSTSDLYLPPDQFGVQTTLSSATQHKSAMAGPTKSSVPRFIVHTDVDEVEPNQDGVIELPPQYSATRAPLQPSVFSQAAPSSNQAPIPDNP